MQIELKSIKIRDLIDVYINDPDKGVWGKDRYNQEIVQYYSCYSTYGVLDA